MMVHRAVLGLSFLMLATTAAANCMPLGADLEVCDAEPYTVELSSNNLPSLRVRLDDRLIEAYWSVPYTADEGVGDLEDVFYTIWGLTVERLERGGTVVFKYEANATLSGRPARVAVFDMTPSTVDFTFEIQMYVVDLGAQFVTLEVIQPARYFADTAEQDIAAAMVGMIQ